MSGQRSDEKTQEFEGNDFDSSSNKRVKEMSIDRLSALPDGILVHILSFLGVEESAVISVLSKRWRFIWAELPRLEFREHSAESEKRHDLVARVNRTLLIRTGIHLEKFEVYFRYNHSFASDVDSWVDFVLKHKVKDVSLLLMGGSEEDDEHYYALPETMYSNSSLTWFSVGGCLMDTLIKIEWPSLTRLRIDDSELPQHVVENILSGCPLLHTLDLEECWGFNYLDVKSQNLCKLCVKDRDDDKENGPLLEIAAPYVQSLYLLFYTEGRKLVLRNIKSLEKAEINFIERWSTSNEVVISTTKELFEILKDIKDLRVGKDYLKVLSELVVNGWQLPISRRKCLIVDSFIEDEHNISGIFALLKSSPNLEMLVIDGFQPEGETWDEAAGDLDCDLLHLKTVEINEFAEPAFGGEPMLTVARNLLKRATVLEEMTVKFRLEEINDYINIGLTLLNYPRSSKKAEVRLH